MYQLPIIERKTVAKDTIEVVFDISAKECDFQPGQYLSVVLPELNFPDPKGNRRDFSIASSPNSKKTLSIAFRISESGFKQTLINMPIGTKVNVDCCYGVLTMPEESAKPIVFIAGGIGITPFLSSIRYAAEEKLPHKITLIYGNRDRESAAYLSELETLEKENQNFKMKKQFGVITKELIESSLENETFPLWYVVGSPKMVRGVRGILSDIGVSGESVRYEEFTGYGQRSGDKNNEEPTINHEAANAWKSDDYESLLNTINKMALIAETDENGTITYANDKFCEISKYSRDELIGNNHRILKSGFHPPSLYEELWKTISSGRVWRGEIKNKAKDGSFYWVDASIAPIFGKDGKIAKYIAVRFPITEKKEAEGRSKVLTGIVEQTPQAWGMADVSGRLVDANAAFSEILGFSLQEIKTMSYADVITPKDREQVIKGISLITPQDNSFFTETEFIRKDGKMVPVMLLVSFYYENGIPKYIYAFISDVTDQKRKEQEIIDRSNETEKMNQLMTGRELKMVELKERLSQAEAEIKELKKNLKSP